jgi:predicted nucleic acid-binding protein
MKPRVYIETSVISYLTARPSRDIIVSAKQQITGDIWSRLIKEFQPVISMFVTQEASKGNKDAAAKRLEVLNNFHVLMVSEDALELAQKLIDKDLIPHDKPEDAAHIAVAAIHGVEYLLTWNYSHLNNIQSKPAIKKFIESKGYICPEICSPEELFGGQS